MKSLPVEQGGQPTEGAGEESHALEALQALMYDGEPSGAPCLLRVASGDTLTVPCLPRHAEIAADLKEQGNSLFAARKFRDAIGFYTRALDEVGKDIGVEDRRVLWSNRAAANLELGAHDSRSAPPHTPSSPGPSRQLWRNSPRHLPCALRTPRLLP